MNWPPLSWASSDEVEEGMQPPEVFPGWWCRMVPPWEEDGDYFLRESGYFTPTIESDIEEEEEVAREPIAIVMNAENIDWNEMAAMLSPVKQAKQANPHEIGNPWIGRVGGGNHPDHPELRKLHAKADVTEQASKQHEVLINAHARNPLTPEIVARIEANKRAAEVRKMELANRNDLPPAVIARIEANKRAAKDRKMSRELGFPNLFPPVRRSTDTTIAPTPSNSSSLPDESEENKAWNETERKRRQNIAIGQIQHAENVAKKRREERLLFLQKQSQEAKTQDVFDEIEREINLLEAFMKKRN